MTDWNQERAERFSLWAPLATYERAKLEAARAVVGPADSPGSGAYVSVGFELALEMVLAHPEWFMAVVASRQRTDPHDGHHYFRRICDNIVRLVPIEPVKSLDSDEFVTEVRSD